MALLQAARAHALGLPLESAYSWGLNRAIFIAAAKRGFKAGGGGGKSEPFKGKGTSKDSGTYYLGDDMAFKTERGGVLLFAFGGEVQTKADFERQVKARFGPKFPSAWKEALAYVKGFDKGVLLSAGDFFGSVYRPVRDDWAEKWTAATETNDK